MPPATRSPDTRPRLAVFCSGTGRSLANLIARSRLPESDPASLDGGVEIVATSSTCPAEDFARDAGIPVVPFDRARAGSEPGERLESLVGEHQIDLVVLAGYLRLLPVPPSLERRVINIHPALLPPLGPADFGGRGRHGLAAHARVLEAFRRGEVDRSGCTVHYCDDAYDTGDVILQRTCPIEPADTPESLAARVFALELDALPDAINKILADTRSTQQAPAETTPEGTP